MGRQTNFFMNKDDLDSFLKYIGEQGDCLIKRNPGEDLGPVVVQPGEDLSQAQYYIFNYSYKVVFDYYDRDWDSTLKIIHKFPQKDWDYLISEARKRLLRIGNLLDYHSEVIELDLCKVDEVDRRVTEGRVWVELLDYDEQGRRFIRSERLETMYTKYSKYIKKKYKISQDKYYYIGPGAYELYKDGWYMGDSRSKKEDLGAKF